MRLQLPPGRQGRLAARGAIVALLVVAVAAWRWLGAKPLPAAKPKAIAVDVATVNRADVPVYLEGLGTVQAFYTVTITAQNSRPGRPIASPTRSIRSSRAKPAAVSTASPQYNRLPKATCASGPAFWPSLPSR